MDEQVLAMPRPTENRCEYCLREHDRYMRWCSEACAAGWMREFYWPVWHTVLARVLQLHPQANPLEINAITEDQTHWIAGGPPPSDCGKLSEYLATKPPRRA